ncbi:MAG: MBOAT family protein [Bacteroidales bacterium]|nr:MBOAT family protein [Bacteroidales bacterium]MBN2820698.1 MBOAT family protein [Bacteroidales bacterium]
MLFNSLEFTIFLPVVFILYWFVTNRNLKLQNFLLLAASYLFYGWWDWRFLSLIVFSSFVDYFIGIGLHQTDDKRKRKLLLLTSILVNLGFLGFFKYFNFFAESFADAFTLLGHPIKATRLNIILPVGISFYTFQTLSYSIDIYKRKLEPTKDIIAFFAFVSFFPQLVAGPIERASNLLPQFYRHRTFTCGYASQGLKYMLKGFFMKLVVADRLAIYVESVFSNYEAYSGVTYILAILFFAFQIYGDFAGYSYIAIGVAKFFGFDLMINFNRPYLARSIKDFWSRWHISLSTWFRDYVYIPLGGNRAGSVRVSINLLATFIISGLWHGANWTFILWGAIHGAIQVFEKNAFKTLFKFKIFRFVYPVVVFIIAVVAFSIFRSKDISQAMHIIKGAFDFSKPLFVGNPSIFFYSILALVTLLTVDIIEEYNQAKEIVFLGKRPTIRYLFYAVTILFILNSGVFNNSQFIYFQF